MIEVDSLLEEITYIEHYNPLVSVLLLCKLDVMSIFHLHSG
jgi:hypothetical protein